MARGTVAFLFALLSVVVIVNALENVKVERTISLSSNIVRHSIDIDVRNDGNSAESSYIVAVKKASHGKLAFLGAEDTENNELMVSLTKADRSDSEFFSVTLPSPLAPKQTVSIRITLAYIHALEAYPAEITQSESQLVRYRDSIFFYTPYDTKEQRTVVQFPSSVIKSFSELKPTVKSGEKVTYGRYSNVKKFEEEDLLVHFENNTPFVAYSSIVREIEVSHWRGQASVEETASLYHEGAKMIGTFSRLDFQRAMSGASSFRTLHASLPATAVDGYFRDEIGNISSSHWREEDNAVSVDFNLRYPLFGGWKNHFYYGFNQPLADIVGKNANGNFVARVSFCSYLDNAAVDEMTLRVVLPEGASNIKVSSPFALDTESTDTIHSYLDVSGRPVAVLTKRNVVSENNDYIEVTYDYSTITAMGKPLRVILAVLACFIVAIIAVRYEMRIAPVSSSSVE